ncbi:MAG TPA: DUF6338 family protein, partial [Pseudonocardiaceae bacterium]|nr:DUF6338 family protein [Pseudonocardiaceae bacterium]
MAGLLIFLVLLGPGFVYTLRMSRIRPEADDTPVREVLILAAASLACDVTALSCFFLFRIILPQVTPSVGGLVNGGSKYARDNYKLVGSWLFILYGLSILLAFFASHQAMRALLGQIL